MEIVTYTRLPVPTDAPPAPPVAGVTPRGRALLTVVAVSSLALALAVPTGATSASFFEVLGTAIFGRVERPAPRYAPVAPVHVTVAPSRKVGRRTGVRQSRTVLQRPMDPVTDPDWYLKDRTLRRGDIVVLRDRVVVFEGAPRTGHRREEFTALDSSRYVSRADRWLVTRMAGLKPRDPVALAREDAVERRERARLKAAWVLD